MLLSKIKVACVVLILGISTLGIGGLICTSPANEPPGTPDKQAHPENLHERVVEMKQQLEQMQKKLAKLEQETQPKQDGRDTLMANPFKYRVEFETGYTESKEGGRIEIREVWGTRPKIEVGGQYLVRGKYVLPPGEHGKLYFYETATGDWAICPTPSCEAAATSFSSQPRFSSLC